MDTADYDTGFTTEFTAWTVPPELAVYPWDDAHPADRLKPGVISVNTPGRGCYELYLDPMPRPGRPGVCRTHARNGKLYPLGEGERWAHDVSIEWHSPTDDDMAIIALGDAVFWDEHRNGVYAIAYIGRDMTLWWDVRDDNPRRMAFIQAIAEALHRSMQASPTLSVPPKSKS